MKPAYKRVLLKLSGEALTADNKFGLDQESCEQVAMSIKQVCDKGVQVGIVIGGGNIFRGALAKQFGFARTPADQIGMLSTLINGLVLQQALMSIGIKSRVMSAIKADPIVESYHWSLAQTALFEGTPVIFVGGTGSPYFTTDTAAALRASEVQADILLKATKVNGVYSDDPLKNPKALKFPMLTYSEVLSKKLNVMDATAIAMCRENQIPICVFNFFEKEALLKAVCNEKIGSLVKGD
jgi:uridylate kinase